MVIDQYHDDFALSIPRFGICCHRMDAWRKSCSVWLRGLGHLSRSRNEHLNPSCLQKATRLVLLQHANRDLGLCHRRNRYRNKVLPATNEIKVFTCLACCPLMPSRRLVLVCSSTSSSYCTPGYILSTRTEKSSAAFWL
jgi:hypothetical protein